MSTTSLMFRKKAGDVALYSSSLSSSVPSSEPSSYPSSISTTIPTVVPSSSGLKCRMATCSRESVLENDKGPLCLLHYCCNKESLQLKKNKVTVSSSTQLERQFTGTVKDLWIKAVGEVVVMLYTAQQNEQKLMRNDPLAIFNLDAHQLNKSLIGTEKLEKKRKSSDSPVEEEVTLKPMRTIWRLESDEAEPAKVVDISEGLVCYGDKCSFCDSELTVRRFRQSSYDVQKNETWGGGAPSIVYEVICRACGTSKTCYD